MTREEAIKRFENQLKGAVAVLDSGFGTNPGESDRIYRERKEMAELAISALREQERRWIPVEERYPKEGEPVLIYCWADKKVEESWLQDGNWGGRFNFRYMSEVSHWMPLPELPKECGSLEEGGNIG